MRTSISIQQLQHQQNRCGTHRNDEQTCARPPSSTNAAVAGRRARGSKWITRWYHNRFNNNNNNNNNNSNKKLENETCDTPRDDENTCACPPSTLVGRPRARRGSASTLVNEENTTTTIEHTRRPHYGEPVWGDKKKDTLGRICRIYVCRASQKTATQEGGTLNTSKTATQA